MSLSAGPIQTEQRGSATVISIAGAQLDYPTLNTIERAATGSAARGLRSTIILNLESVETIPSVMMGALVDMLKRMRQRGSSLMLVGMSDSVRSSFAVTRLDQMFDLHDSIDAALATL
jgi:anti-sigma B factor antagonist